MMSNCSVPSVVLIQFLGDFAVRFDHNLANRDLRIVKVEQKISGCGSSQDGAQAFARICGY
jgi:transposase